MAFLGVTGLGFALRLLVGFCTSVSGSPVYDCRLRWFGPVAQTAKRLPPHTGLPKFTLCGGGFVARLWRAAVAWNGLADVAVI